MFGPSASLRAAEVSVAVEVGRKSRVEVGEGLGVALGKGVSVAGASVGVLVAGGVACSSSLFPG